MSAYPPLPLDVFPVIFRHLPQEGLCACLRVCRAFHHAITTDEVLLARLQSVHSFRQLKRYLQVDKTYYCLEYYTDIGQDDEAKFPYYQHCVVTKVDPLAGSMHYASAPGDPRPCTGAMLTAEGYMMAGHNIFGVHKFDVMLRLLECLWKYLNSSENARIFERMPFINTNMRKAIKQLKRHTKENAKFGEFAALQAGSTQWFKEVMALRPEEEPDDSSDEESSPQVPPELVGATPIYFCKRCDWKVGGFTCQSPRENGTCGALLVLQRDTSLRCPKGCGVMGPPVCCRNRAMKPNVDHVYTITASSPQSDISWKACPVFSCKKCKFGVDGIRCYACATTGNDVERSGFFERVWCAYVWVCPNGCGRRDRGGKTYGGFISCRCQGEDSALVEYAYLDTFGHPQN